MTEFRAIVLVFVVGSVLTVASCFALHAMHASGTVYALVTVALIGLGADTSSRIGMHYSSLKERREREDILLR